MSVIQSDATILRYAGVLGHRFVVVAGVGDSRRTRLETNSLDGAKEAHGEADEAEQSPRIYEQISRRKWLDVTDRAFR